MRVTCNLESACNREKGASLNSFVDEPRHNKFVRPSQTTEILGAMDGNTADLLRRSAICADIIGWRGWPASPIVATPALDCTACQDLIGGGTFRLLVMQLAHRLSLEAVGLTPDPWEGGQKITSFPGRCAGETQKGGNGLRQWGGERPQRVRH